MKQWTKIKMTVSTVIEASHGAGCWCSDRRNSRRFLYIVREGPIPLYIGQAKCWRARMRQHFGTDPEKPGLVDPLAQSPLGLLADANRARARTWRVTICCVPPRRINIIESAAIESLRPCLNKAHNQRNRQPLPTGLVTGLEGSWNRLVLDTIKLRS